MERGKTPGELYIGGFYAASSPYQQQQQKECASEHLGVHGYANIQYLQSPIFPNHHQRGFLIPPTMSSTQLTCVFSMLDKE